MAEELHFTNEQKTENTTRQMQRLAVQHLAAFKPC
jgi:hypothetical protein